MKGTIIRPTPLALMAVIVLGGSPLTLLSESDRSREVLDYECRTELGRRQVTLFANGTVRLRDGLYEDEQMKLGELDPDQLGGYLRRLDKVDLSEATTYSTGMQGQWVEQCTLELDRPNRRPERFSFGRFDSLPLSLSRIVNLANELEDHVIPLLAPGMPLDYEAKVGDVLRRHDDALFEVISFTSDQLGVELQGIEQPLTLYLRPEDIRQQFVEIVSRKRW